MLVMSNVYVGNPFDEAIPVAHNNNNLGNQRLKPPLGEEGYHPRPTKHIPHTLLGSDNWHGSSARA